MITNGGVKTISEKKAAEKDNIADFKSDIFIGKNQNSYKGTIIVSKGKAKEEKREYIPNLPAVYSKISGDKKICLTYFITILSNCVTFDTELISIMCVPNGNLAPHYGDRPLKAGKNPGKARFNFKEVNKFELLEGEPSRIKIIHKNPKMNDWVKEKLKFYLGFENES